MPAGGGLKRWSAAEDAALMRAWADTTDNSAKSLQLAFQTQCAAASVPQERSANSLQLRRGLYTRMYEIVCAFHKTRQLQPKNTPDDSNGGDGDLADDFTADATTEYSSDSWFELPLEEQRRWFASLNTRAYAFSELTREVFDQVDAIFKQKYNGAERKAASYTQPRKATERVRTSLSTIDLRASIERLKGTAPPLLQQQRWSNDGVITSHQGFSGSHAGRRGASLRKFANRTGGGNEESAAENENDSNSGSSTESDDEIPSWDDDDEDNGEAVPETPVNYQISKKAELEPNISNKTAEHGHVKFSEQHQVDKVDPNFLELVSILETQARHIGEVFIQMKRVRREESRERRYVLHRIEHDQSERQRVLEDIAQREHELQQEREEWEEERRALKQELALLRKRKSSKVAATTSSSSSTSGEQ